MEQKMNKTERLEAICKGMFGGNMSAMGRALGISPQVMKSWFERGTWKPCDIYEKMPELNAEWLLTGEGEMLKEEAQPCTAAN